MKIFFTNVKTEVIIGCTDFVEMKSLTV